jgi:RHH-type transcriptional regulator, proline utilization regulon repressor / proline dehydrogenase / delta 1-pyrroline-5-carboxylate dehydrogenase
MPRDVLQLLPGPGEVGAALAADARTRAVLFTGSTEVARHIQQSLAVRGNIPLIAETGGQNAMIVDSSALPEQVVGDVLASAFDSAGQRCSALRILCLQDGIADRVVEMLKGAMAELRLGDPAMLETDVGPVIDAEADAGLNSYIAAHAQRILFQSPLPPECASGTFVAPTLLQIRSIKELQREVFGPILHVVRFERSALPRLIEDINATGYGLTLGIHSRIDETINLIAERARAGNIYVNRNMIGAVVGVQPFGGEGLSGTGPKAGGPLILHRLLRAGPPPKLSGSRDERKLDAFSMFSAWAESGAGGVLGESERTRLSEFFKLYRETSPLGLELQLRGPVGEENRLFFQPRGQVLGIAGTAFDALHQFGAALATGNRFVLAGREGIAQFLKLMSKPLLRHVEVISASLKSNSPLAPALSHGGEREKDAPDYGREPSPLAGEGGQRSGRVRGVPDIGRGGAGADWRAAKFDAVLLSDDTRVSEVAQALAARSGPIVQIVSAAPEFPLFGLVKEKTVSVNTTAAGGNASLMTIGK